MKWSLPQFAVVLAVAITLFLWPSIFGGKVLMPLDLLSHSPPFEAPPGATAHNPLIGDMLWENLAWKTFQRECVFRHELPLWNPYTFCGHPLYATGQASTFYPFNLILVLVPLPFGYVAFTALHLLMGGIFTYLYLRRVGVGGFGASVGGLVFAMCTYFAVRFIWPMLLGSAIWLPLMLLWIDWMSDTASLRKVLKGLLSGAVLFSLPLLSGFFEIAFYVFFACGLYTLVMGLRVIWRERSLSDGAAFFAKVGATTVLAAMLAAPQLLPFFEVAKLSIRSGEMTYRSAQEKAITWPEVLTFAVPEILGNPTTREQFDLSTRTFKPIKAKNNADNYYYGPQNYVESTNYIGLLPLAFAVFGLFAPGKRRFYFWLLLAVSLALAFVTPVYKLLFAAVPGMDQVRSPWRWTLITMFACTYLAAIGADYWYRQLSAPRNRLTAAAATIKFVGALVLVAIVVILMYRPGVLTGVAERILKADPRAAGVFATSAELVNLLWMNAARFAVIALAVVFVLAMAYWRQWGAAGASVISLSALGLAALDLGQLTYRFNTHSDPGILQQRPPIVQKLQEAAANETFRIGRFGWQNTFFPNSPTFCGLQDVGGYDSVILRDFARYMQAIETQHFLYYNFILQVRDANALSSPLCRLLNLRYLVSIDKLKNTDYEQVDVPGNMRLYRLKDDKSLGRAFFVQRVEGVFDVDEAIGMLKANRVDVRHEAVVQTIPGGTTGLVDAFPGQPGKATITEYRPSRVRIETATPARQFLVLCDVDYPGWKAYIDGTPTGIMVTNGIFRGVSVPAGNHTVEFRFEPCRFQAGVVMSAACLVGLVGLSIVARVSRPKPSPAYLPQA